MSDLRNQYWVYILENSVGQFYIGQSEDLERRLLQHNSADQSGRKFAPKHGPWKLVWSEAHPTRASAMNREREVKAMKSSRWIREHLLNR